eukprot:20476-Eustigmatos_ZCMA.PRE.1
MLNSDSTYLNHEGTYRHYSVHEHSSGHIVTLTWEGSAARRGESAPHTCPSTRMTCIISGVAEQRPTE